MHRAEFIRRVFQDGLGDECTAAIAAMVFAYANANGLVDCDENGDWDFVIPDDELPDCYLCQLYDAAVAAGYSEEDYEEEGRELNGDDDC